MTPFWLLTGVQPRPGLQLVSSYWIFAPFRTWFGTASHCLELNGSSPQMEAANACAAIRTPTWGYSALYLWLMTFMRRFHWLKCITSKGQAELEKNLAPVGGQDGYESIGLRVDQACGNLWNIIMAQRIYLSPDWTYAWVVLSRLSPNCRLRCRLNWHSSYVSYET